MTPANRRPDPVASGGGDWIWDITKLLERHEDHFVLELGLQKVEGEAFGRQGAAHCFVTIREFLAQRGIAANWRRGAWWGMLQLAHHSRFIWGDKLKHNVAYIGWRGPPGLQADLQVGFGKLLRAKAGLEAGRQTWTSAPRCCAARLGAK